MAKPQRRIYIETPSGTKTHPFSLKEAQRYEDLIAPYEAEFDGQVVLAQCGSQLHELGELVEGDPTSIHFLDTAHTDGHRVYMRSLSFVFILAINRHFPRARAIIEHSISGGSYCTIRQGEERLPLDSNTRDLIEQSMRSIIEADLPIERMELSLEEARQFFLEIGRPDKERSIRYLSADHVSIYKLGQYYDSFYGFMVPSTRYVSTFHLELFERGLVLMGPERAQRGVKRNFVPQYKLLESYQEAERWSTLQKIENTFDLNVLIASGQVGELVRMTESLQQHRIMEIAQEIRRQRKRLILVAAPSSSGKTSFAYKLKNDLRVLGLRPISLSLDDYYVDRLKTPLDADGAYDFESLYAIDLERFEQDMEALLAGQEVEAIRYDFLSGKRCLTGKTIRLKEGDPIIIEGIHGLNPKLFRRREAQDSFKIYLSVTTQINLDDHNRVHTTDLRLMRRMARDQAFRGKDIRETIAEWPRVRRGEKEHIFPYQEEADVLFNSSFVYEIAVLKPLIEGPLQAIPPEDESFLEARRLLALLKYFLPMTDQSDIVNTSILREFIGGSKIV